MAVRKNLEKKADAVKSGSDPERDERVSNEAYYLAEKRGFLPGHAEDDWLKAERSVLGNFSGVQPKG